MRKMTVTVLACMQIVGLVSCGPSESGLAPEQIAETMVAQTSIAQNAVQSETPTPQPSTATPTWTIEPSPTTSPPLPTPGPVIYHDDFSEDIGAWLYCDACEWKNDKLYMGPFSARNELPASITLCGACGEASYFRMAVDATYEEGYVDRGYGFEIGLGSERTLRFVITTLQVYVVVEFEGEKVGEILAFENSGHLKPSKATNRIELLVEPTGSPGTATISFRINDKNVYVLYNQHVEPAGVGLVITYHALGVAFDNFEFEALGPSSSHRPPDWRNLEQPPAPTSNPAVAGLEPIEGQQVWFDVNSFTPSGSIPYDIYQIFELDSPWESYDQIDVVQFTQADFERTLKGRAPEEDPGIREKVDFAIHNDIEIAILVDGLIDWDIDAIYYNDYDTSCDGSELAKLSLDHIKRIYQHNAEVAYVVMDGPFGRTSRGGGPNNCDFTYQEVSEELLEFMRTIRAEYPDIRFGLRESTHCYRVGSYPGMCGSRDLLEVLDTFMRVVREGGEQVDFFHAEAPYDLNQKYSGLQGWQKIKSLEEYVKENGLRFGLVYTSELGGELSDELFYHDTLMAKVKYDSVGGDPDDTIIESWLDHPKKWLPEDEPYTFTYLLKDFLTLSSNEIIEKLEQQN